MALFNEIIVSYFWVEHPTWAQLYPKLNTAVNTIGEVLTELCVVVVVGLAYLVRETSRLGLIGGFYRQPQES